jgi:hypothetical protein
MKTVRLTFVVIAATFALLASLAVSTSAVGLASAVPGGTVAGTLNLWNSAAGPYETGQQIQLQANFSGGPRQVDLYREGPAGTWTSVGSQLANSNGNAYFTYTFVTGTQRLYAEDANGLETEIDTFNATAPVPQTGVLDNPSSSGKTWTAHFTPGVAGKSVQLQIQRIYTKETDEVNEAAGTPKVGPWVTIATAAQNAAGDVTLNAPSPYPYRVEHNYRAVSGSSISNVKAFGLGQVTPKSTGLAAVYFNTNEGHSVDTRTHYYEGEFAMKSGAEGCTDVGYSDPTKRLKNSVMKGRGNYSWSFNRKGFTLKLGKSTDLCGMGANKKYALVSQDYDKSFLRNALAGYIGKKFNHMAWTPDSRPVDLYVNGSYRGNYLLIERISIDPARVNVPELKADDGDKDCNGVVQALGQRVNASHPNNLDPCKTGGYILEWDYRKGADYNAYLGSDSGYVGVKDPENDYSRVGASTGPGTLTNAGISSQQKSYISSYLNTVDSTLRGSNFTSDTSGWKKYIDEASAVDYYIAMEYMKPVDGNMWASVYMYKQRDSSAGAGDGKLFFGPMWDFDLAAGSATRAGNVVSSSGFYLRNNLGVSAQQDTTSGKTWFNRLNEDPDFRAAVKARWNAVKGSINTNSFIDTEKSIISSSANTSFSSGPSSHSYRISTYQVIKSNWDADVSYLRSWASSRTSWLNGSSGFN